MIPSATYRYRHDDHDGPTCDLCGVPLKVSSRCVDCVRMVAGLRP